MEEVLLSHPEVVAVGRQQGRAELSEHAIGVEGAETEVSIDMDKPLEKGLPKRTKAELLAALREDFARIPGLAVQIGQPISHRIDHIPARGGSAIKLLPREARPASPPAAVGQARQEQIENSGWWTPRWNNRPTYPS
jgi:Cu/Ag efflux pump CusA